MEVEYVYHYNRNGREITNRSTYLRKKEAITPEKIQEMKLLHQMGYKKKEICDKFNICYRTLMKYLNIKNC